MIKNLSLQEIYNKLVNDYLSNPENFSITDCLAIEGSLLSLQEDREIENLENFLGSSAVLFDYLSKHQEEDKFLNLRALGQIYNLKFQPKKIRIKDEVKDLKIYKMYVNLGVQKPHPKNICKKVPDYINYHRLGFQNVALVNNYNFKATIQLKKAFLESIKTKNLIFKKSKGFHPCGFVIQCGEHYGVSARSSDDQWDSGEGLNSALRDLVKNIN
jgi:hypothetical protein